MMSNIERTEADRMAEEVGVIIGAACGCDSISKERLQSAVDRAVDLLMEAASDEAEAAIVVDRLKIAFGTGQAAVESEKVDPWQVEAAFIELERVLLESE